MNINQEITELRVRVKALEARVKNNNEAWAALRRASSGAVERIAALEAGATCPHIVSSDEGTSYCDLALQTQDKLDRLIAQDRDDAPTRAGSLVERVALAISGVEDSSCWDDETVNWAPEARAAIREVAAWLRVESEGRSDD